MQLKVITLKPCMLHSVIQPQVRYGALYKQALILSIQFTLLTLFNLITLLYLIFEGFNGEELRLRQTRGVRSSYLNDLLDKR